MIGIIGGSGFEALLENAEKIKIDTPYGHPSDEISTGMIAGRKVAFLPRHGAKHTIPPHSINFRANIHALKELGCERVIAVCAVGSLNEDFMPGNFVVPDQFIDLGKYVATYSDVGNVFHVSMADPFCPELNKALIEAGKAMDAKMHDRGTYLSISGPQFSTRAASGMYRNFADIIGMTGASEAILAREKEMCFSILATISDYDIWSEKPVDLEEVKTTVSENFEQAKKLIEKAVSKIPESRRCGCGNALKNARF